MLVMLRNCADCANNVVKYQLEVIPMYSADTAPDSTQKGLKSKIVFSDPIQVNTDLNKLFTVKLINTSSVPPEAQVGQTSNNTISKGRG